MSVVKDTESQGRKKTRSKSKRKATKAQKSSSRQASPPKPPQSVEPGWIHELVAAVGLKGIEALAERNGVKIDVGEVKKVDEYMQTSSVGGEDAPQPIDVASRVVAHLFHRVPFIRKLGKKFEGKDKKAGFLSDLGTLVVQVAARNEELLKEKGAEALSEALAKKGQSTVIQDVPPSTVVPDGHTDFGVVDPIQ